MKIEVVNVTKILRKCRVLDDVSLVMEQGTIYGLKGINGSGKTMFLRLLAGLIYPSSGSIFCDGKKLGKDISFPPDVGLLLEAPAFLDEFTAAANLRLLANIRQKVREMRIKEVLDQVGLSYTDTRKYRHFSLGMKQRLGIAGAILEHPQLLLIDEPTNALDTKGVEMVKELLLEEKEKGALVVLACHDFSFLEEISDYIYTVQEGKVFQ